MPWAHGIVDQFAWTFASKMECLHDTTAAYLPDKPTYLRSWNPIVFEAAPRGLMGVRKDLWKLRRWLEGGIRQCMAFRGC